MDIQIVQTLLGALLGGGILGFIEFLIRRKDAKKDKNKEIIDAINKLDKKVDDGFAKLDQKIDDVDAKVDERSAVSARVRILRFADEMNEGRKHSKDSYEQALSDVDFYELYCYGDGKDIKGHPSFKNNKTEQTIEYIKRSYAERLEKHDFL